MPYMTELEVFDKFSHIVARSLRIDVAQVQPDMYLTDLGAESLDLIEITMETETQFHIFLPDKSILETAVEIFGSDVLEKEGYLTDEGARLLARRMPEADSQTFAGAVAVKDLQHYFLKISTWVRMIQNLVQFTPGECPSCGGAMTASMGFRMKCTRCAEEITLRSGEELNREWVRGYYEAEYLPRTGAMIATRSSEAYDLGKSIGA